MQAEEGCQTDLTCQALKVANGHLISPPVSMSIPFNQSLHDSGRSSPIPAAKPTLRQSSTKIHYFVGWHKQQQMTDDVPEMHP